MEYSWVGRCIEVRCRCGQRYAADVTTVITDCPHCGKEFLVRQWLCEQVAALQARLKRDPDMVPDAELVATLVETVAALLVA